jgi:threonine aldolase
MYFGSDNQTGASDQVFKTLQQANTGVTGAYGDDEWTQQATQMIQELFECDADVFFVSTGTAANSLALACMGEPWDNILCHGQAHIINDELTAPEFFTQGARLVGLDTQSGKLRASVLADYLSHGAAHPPHNPEPTVLSLTQANESGQVYSIDEVTELASIAKNHGLSVHMDGARFSNAVAALQCSPAEITWKAGVDVLCLGATKNGALSAEAVVFFNKSLSKRFVQHRKRSGHLISKSRWLGAQFYGWLQDNHWLSLARHANDMAKRLNEGLSDNEQTHVIWPVVANELFIVMSKKKITELRNQGAVFYEWPRTFVPEDLKVEAHEDVVRLVTSFRTSLDEVNLFLSALKADSKKPA